jgi:hypothetical protein
MREENQNGQTESDMGMHKVWIRCSLSMVCRHVKRRGDSSTLPLIEVCTESSGLNSERHSGGFASITVVPVLTPSNTIE